MSTIAVAGATGTLGARILERLTAGGHDVVSISRSTGVDLHTGAGLPEALSGAQAVVDASNAFPTDPEADLVETLVQATRNLVEAAQAAGVKRLVAVSIANVEEAVFDHFPYYVAKREQEKVVAGSALETTIVKTTQWHEFATNPAAVTFEDAEVLVEDWLLQPVAVDAVADAVVAHLLESSPSAVVHLTGPEQVRLPELTQRLLAARGDDRPVRTLPPALPELSTGVLLAPESAQVTGPTVAQWLRTQHG